MSSEFEVEDRVRFISQPDDKGTVKAIERNGDVVVTWDDGYESSHAPKFLEHLNAEAAPTPEVQGKIARLKEIALILINDRLRSTRTLARSQVEKLKKEVEGL